MKKCFTGIALSIIFAAAGCDVDVHEAGSPAGTVHNNAPSVAPADNGTHLNIDVDTPAENRVERRIERREGLREAVDNVDVEVGNGGVKVDVDGDK